MSKAVRITTLVLLAFVGIFLAGGCLAIYPDTIVSPWTLGTIGLCAGVVTSPMLHRSWDRLTLLDSTAGNWAMNIIFVGIIAIFAALLANRAGASDTVTETTATIDRKYTTQRTSGGGRRHATRRTYTVYNVDMLFPSGTRKHQEIGIGTYNRIRSGSTISVDVRDGLLGWPVIDPKFTKRKTDR